MPSPAERVAEALQRAQLRYTDYAGGQLFWQRWAAADTVTAPPLILLHGGFGSWNHWFLNVDELSRQRDVWTVDLPGLGNSGDMPEPHTCKHFADLLLSGINRVVYKNWDMLNKKQDGAAPAAGE